MTREFIILPQFDRLWKGLRLDDEDLQAVEEFLCLQPDYGNIIKGTGGLVKMARPDKRSVYKSIISGLDEAIMYENKGILKGTRARRVTIAPVPHYGAKKIKSIRNELGLSQIAFAEALGVSKKTVEAWEAGRNEPQGPAQRILELLQKESDLLEKHEIVRT